MHVNMQKNSHPIYDMKFIGKNPSNISKYIVCATTEKQTKLNRESLRKLMES
jgi:hypothetical protein